MPKLYKEATKYNRVEYFKESRTDEEDVKLRVRVYVWGQLDEEDWIEFDTELAALQFLAVHLTRQSKEHDRLYKKLEYIEKLVAAH